MKYYDFDYEKLANDVVVKKNRHHYSYQDIADRTGLHSTTIRSVALLIPSHNGTKGIRAVTASTATSLIMWLGGDFKRYIKEVPVEFGKS